MKNETSKKGKAIMKVIACIDSSNTLDHLAACKKMINLLYNFKITKTTLTYIMLKYRSKQEEIFNG